MDELFGLLGISSLVDPFRNRVDPVTNSALIVFNSKEIVNEQILTSITSDLSASIGEIENENEQTTIVSVDVKKFVSWAKDFQKLFAGTFDPKVIEGLNTKNPMKNSPEFKKFVMDNISEINDSVKIFYVPKLMKTLLGFMGALPPKNSKIFHFNAFQSLFNDEDNFQKLTKNPYILQYWSKLKIYTILSIITSNSKILGWYYQDILTNLINRDQFFNMFSLQPPETDAKPKSRLGKIQQYLFNMEGKPLGDFIEPSKTTKYHSNPILKRLLEIVNFDKPLIFHPNDDMFQKIEKVLKTRSIEYQLFKVFLLFEGADENLTSIPYFFEGSTTFVSFFKSTKNYFPIQTFYEIINKVDFPSPQFKKDLNEGKITNVKQFLYETVWDDEEIKQLKFGSTVNEFLQNLRISLLKGDTRINLPPQITSLDPDLQIVAYENGALLKEWYYIELFIQIEKQHRGVIGRIQGIVVGFQKFVKGLLGIGDSSIDGKQYVNIFPSEFQNTDIFQPYLKKVYQLQKSYLPNVDIKSLPPMFLKPNIEYEKENMVLPLAVVFDELVPLDETLSVVNSELWWFDNRGSRRIIQLEENPEKSQNKYRILESQIRFPETIKNNALTQNDFSSDEFSEWTKIMFEKRPQNRQCLNLLYDRFILSEALGKTKKEGQQFLENNDASAFVIQLFNSTVNVIANNDKFDLSFHTECETPSLPEPVLTLAPVVFIPPPPVLAIEPATDEEDNESTDTEQPTPQPTFQPTLQPTPPQSTPQHTPPQSFQSITTTLSAPSFSTPFTASGLMHQKRRKRSKPRINRSHRRRSPPRNRHRRRRSPRRSSRRRS
jgi:hypothetical protein